MTLVEHYRADIAGLSGREAAAIRTMWHYAARRYLHLLMLTSDAVPTMPGVPVPYDAMWLYRPVEELVELYRATKRRGKGRPQGR